MAANGEKKDEGNDDDSDYLDNHGVGMFAELTLSTGYFSSRSEVITVPCSRDFDGIHMVR